MKEEISPEEKKRFELAKKHIEEARKHAEKKEKVAEEARKKGIPRMEATLKSGNTSSLGKMIQTKEQADFFMKILRSL